VWTSEEVARKIVESQAAVEDPADKEKARLAVQMKYAQAFSAQIEQRAFTPDNKPR
jgi:hypothetical protein